MYPVLLIQLSQYLCRNACHDAVIRHITVYNRPCRNDTVFPDGHSATDCCTRTDPASASDVDRFCILKVMETVRILLRQTLIGEKRMARCRNRHVCTYPHTIFKRNRCAVQKCTVIVDKTAFSKVDIDTVFTVKRCKNHCPAILCGRNQFFQKTLLSFLHPQRCAVEFITGFHSERMVFFQIFAVSIVESASFHSFPVIHVCSATQNVFK